MSVVKLIKSDAFTNSVQITTICANEDQSMQARSHLSDKYFWDVVGDSILRNAITRINPSSATEQAGVCYLMPALEERAGIYYSSGVLDQMLSHSKFCGNWEYRIHPEPTCWQKNHNRRSHRKENLFMKKQYELPSFEDYARSNNLSFSSGASQSFQSAEDNVPISPLSGGTSYAISSSARNKALDFAHPIDSEIIGALDNPVVNTLIGKLVQANYDANYGLTLSTGIHITPNSYPDLYEVIVECANTLNIPVPYVVISNAVSGINACASGTEQFTFIMISSMLPLVMTRDELKFVIGHECGHVALGHVVYHTAGNIIGNAGGLLPFVGQYISKTITYPLRAWGRRSEISADRAGLLCCGSLEVAQKALYKLEAGFLGRMDVNIDEYIKESERMLNSTLIGKYAELSLEHPILPKRMKALSLFANSETYDNCVGNCQSSGSISRERLNKEIEKILEIM